MQLPRLFTSRPVSEVSNRQIHGPPAEPGRVNFLCRVAGVHQQQQVFRRSALLAIPYAHRAHIRILPIRARHFAAAHVQPGYILHLGARGSTLQKGLAAELGVPPPQLRQQAHELEQILMHAPRSRQSTQESSLSWQYALLLPFCVRPNSSPACSIGTPWEKNSVANRLRICRLPQRHDAGIVRRPLDAAIPAEIIAGAVAVALQIRVIVTLVVGDQGPRA